MENYRRIHEYFNEINKKTHMFQNYMRNFEPLLDIQKQINERMKYNSLAIQESMKPILAMHDAIKILAGQLASVIPLIPSLNPFLKEFKSLPERLKKALLTLAKEGWFFDTNMPISSLWDLEKALENGESEGVEEFLVKYFEENLDSIQERIIGGFPHRKNIVIQALDAHRQGLYSLAVTALMPQIDGMCYDKTNQHYFIRKNGKPRTAIYVQELSEEECSKYLLAPLTESLPIHASEKERERDESFNYINRHTVLHGESLDYGTQVNSLKVISMMNYITQMFCDDDIEEQRE